MRLSTTVFALALGMVNVGNVHADIIFGNRCTYIPASGITPAGLDCEQVIIRVDFDQFLEPPPIFDPPPVCPECAFAEIIDVPGLDLSQVKLPSEFALASRSISDKHLPLHAIDNPLIPNLLITYVGDQPIAAPTDVGTLDFRVLNFPGDITELNYHAQAFDANGQLVFNKGSIAIVPEPCSALMGILGLAVFGLLVNRRRRTPDSNNAVGLR